MIKLLQDSKTTKRLANHAHTRWRKRGSNDAHQDQRNEHPAMTFIVKLLRGGLPRGLAGICVFFLGVKIYTMYHELRKLRAQLCEQKQQMLLQKVERDFQLKRYRDENASKCKLAFKFSELCRILKEEYDIKVI